MPQKRRRKGDPRDEAEDFQMMNIDFNLPPSIPIATSTFTNISQWHIDGDRIHGTSVIASVEVPTAVTAPLATDSTTQATFDYNVEVDSTFYDADEDISPEHDPSAKRSFSGVFHFCLTTITAVLNHVLFIS